MRLYSLRFHSYFSTFCVSVCIHRLVYLFGAIIHDNFSNFYPIMAHISCATAHHIPPVLL